MWNKCGITVTQWAEWSNITHMQIFRDFRVISPTLPIPWSYTPDWLWQKRHLASNTKSPKACTIHHLKSTISFSNSIMKGVKNMSGCILCPLINKCSEPADCVAHHYCCSRPVCFYICGLAMRIPGWKRLAYSRLPFNRLPNVLPYPEAELLWESETAGNSFWKCTVIREE